MKNLLHYAIACAIVTTTCLNCSVESIDESIIPEESISIENVIIADTQNPCVGQDPQASITNNGTVNITLQIATIDGTVLHTVQDLAPGNSSAYLMFAEGDIIFNISKNTTGIADEKVVYAMEECMSFDIEVDTDNYLTNAVPQNL